MSNQTEEDLAIDELMKDFKLPRATLKKKLEIYTQSNTLPPPDMHKVLETLKKKDDGQWGKTLGKDGGRKSRSHTKRTKTKKRTHKKRRAKRATKRRATRRA
jgi:hypothetical protein